MLKKVVGWLLALFGILIILWGIWSSYNIFTGRKPAPQIFEVPKIEESSANPKGASTMEEQMQQQVQQLLKEQLEKMFSPDMMPKILNLASWSIFMTILVFAGGKISVVGVHLLKSTKLVKPKRL